MVAPAKPQARMTRAQVEQLRKQPRRALVTITPTIADENGGTNRITIAANVEARDMFELDLETLRTENYLRNPVVMWSHDTTGRTPSGGLPIARSTKVGRNEAGGFEADFEFLTDDDFAERVRNAWDKGFIRAASVSWGGGDWTFLENGKIRETNAELYEWSLVSVPADPDALRLAERELGMPEGMLAPAKPEQRHNEEQQASLDERLSALEDRVSALEEPEEDDESDDDGDGDGGGMQETAAAGGENDDDRAFGAELADLAGLVRAKG